MNTTPLNVTIDGMHCAACSTRIENVISRMGGVGSVHINLASRTGQIVLLPGTDSTLLIPQILETISALGFSATFQEAAPEDDFISATQARWQAREIAQQADLASRKDNLLPAFLATPPLLLLSMGEMVGIPLPAALDPAYNPLGFALAQLALCLPVLWSGRRFFLLGAPALFRKAPTMDTLVALGTGAAFIYSVWSTLLLFLSPDMQTSFLASSPLPHAPLSNAGATAGALSSLNMGHGAGHAPELYYESTSVVIALVSLGKYLEIRSTMRTSEAMKGLLSLSPETAFRLNGFTAASPQMSEHTEIPLAQVSVGDTLLIKPGGRIPVDGIILYGESLVDESMLTGESLPVEKRSGLALSAGTMNQNGNLVMQAEKVGSNTVLARIVRLVQDAQGSKAPIAAIADRISLYFVPVVMVLALCTFAFWFFYAGSTAFALRTAVAVLVIACPCAMGLATPMSIIVATGRGAQLGVLFKNGQALENAARVTAIAFDKTGTLTEGRPALTEVVILPGMNNLFPAIALDHTTLLRIAASLEVSSEHALARAVVDHAQKEHLELLPVHKFQAIPGKGVAGEISLAGQTITARIGNQAFAKEQARNIAILEGLLEPFSRDGKTPTILVIDDHACALFVLADPLRPESPAIVKELANRNIRSVMLTGDTETTAQAIAAQAGIRTVLAGMMPDGKERAIAELQATGAIVAMVGDGINDAPALARADLGIAMGSGIDVAVDTGDVVLMHQEKQGLATLLAALDLGRAALRNIRQNLFWAFAFNSIGIPFAAGFFHLWGGPVLSPMLAGSAMALSSVAVVTNALRLRFFQPQQ